MEILTAGGTDLRHGPGVTNQLKEAGGCQQEEVRKRLTETTSMLLGEGRRGVGGWGGEDCAEQPYHQQLAPEIRGGGEERV